MYKEFREVTRVDAVEACCMYYLINRYRLAFRCTCHQAWRDMGIALNPENAH